MVQVSNPVAWVADPIKPDDKTFQFKGLDKDLTMEGTYTIDVWHTTPFGEESLGHVTININRTIEVKGALISSE